jgi:hypothetical protein
MDVDVYDVSTHGWANNYYSTTRSLPSDVHHAVPAPVPMLSSVSYRYLLPKDDTRRLCPRESLELAAPRETNSFHP